MSDSVVMADKVCGAADFRAKIGDAHNFTIPEEHLSQIDEF